MSKQLILSVEKIMIYPVSDEILRLKASFV